MIDDNATVDIILVQYPMSGAGPVELSEHRVLDPDTFLESRWAQRNYPGSNRPYRVGLVTKAEAAAIGAAILLLHATVEAIVTNSEAAP